MGSFHLTPTSSNFLLDITEGSSLNLFKSNMVSFQRGSRNESSFALRDSLREFIICSYSLKPQVNKTSSYEMTGVTGG